MSETATQPQPQQEPRPRPGFGRPISEIVSDLSKPVPAKFIKQRKQRNNTLDYITWHDAAKMLDYYAPGWSWAIHSIQESGGMLVVHGTLTIPSEEGDIKRDATGVEDMDNKGYGDSVSNGSAMAFKRACALFGLGRHLYEK